MKKISCVIMCIFICTYILSPIDPTLATHYRLIEGEIFLPILLSCVDRQCHMSVSSILLAKCKILHL